MLDFDRAVDMLRAGPSRQLIAIDGLPVSGKSTLADRLETELGAKVIYLDDFVRPASEWRGKVEPGFPVPYIRYDAFVAAVTDLARNGLARYRRYDWASGQVAAEETVLEATGQTVVEGVSALHPQLAPLYDLRFWVDSDPSTTLAASLARGVGDWEHDWRALFMPSVALYLESGPKGRADHVLRGRGAR